MLRAAPPSLYGFALQETTLPFQAPEGLLTQLAETVTPRAPATEYRFFTELATAFASKPGYT